MMSQVIFYFRNTRKKTIYRYPYTLHGQSLQKKQTKYLWVTLADSMMRNTYTEQTAAKRNKKLGFLKRNLKINNADIKTAPTSPWSGQHLSTAAWFGTQTQLNLLHS